MPWLFLHPSIVPIINTLWPTTSRVFRDVGRYAVREGQYEGGVRIADTSMSQLYRYKIEPIL